MMHSHTPGIFKHFPAFRTDLLNSGAITEATQSVSPVTESWPFNGGLTWTGHDHPGQGDEDFSMKVVTQEYAKTVGLQFIEGRDFRTGGSGADAHNIILNETSVRHMGLKKPVGTIVTWMKNQFTVIGVVKDNVMESPYETPVPAIYNLAPWPLYYTTLRINPALSAREALQRISPIFEKYSPDEPFDYKFIDEEYDAKFRSELHIGRLAGFFTILAIFISCLGLFGLASFIAEQRTREIGVRKVLGATIFNLWKLLSKEFVLLISVSCLIAIPIAWWLLSQWLQQYAYKTEISWWIFVIAVLGALTITILTISYQAIKAATANPVKSLRTE